jgi:hypothetical protein
MRRTTFLCLLFCGACGPAVQSTPELPPSWLIGSPFYVTFDASTGTTEDLCAADAGASCGPPRRLADDWLVDDPLSGRTWGCRFW